MRREWHAILVMPRFPPFSRPRIRHPVTWTDEGALGEDIGGPLLLAVGVLGDLQRSGAF